MCCAYIVQNLLAATSTASLSTLIGSAACYAGVHALAESVSQNCVLGKYANLFLDLGLGLGILNIGTLGLGIVAGNLQVWTGSGGLAASVPHFVVPLSWASTT